MKPRKLFFIVDCGTYPNEILVAVNQTYEDILNYHKRKNWRTDDLVKTKTQLEKYQKDLGYVILWDDCSLLMGLRIGKQMDWKFFDTLIHECAHVVQFVFSHRKVKGDEAFAYQLEYIFRKIRHKLYQSYAKKSNRKTKRAKRKGNTKNNS